MRNTIRKYKKRLLNKKTIKLRHKKYRAGSGKNVKSVRKIKSSKKKPVFNIVEEFEDALKKTDNILNLSAIEAAPVEMLSVAPAAEKIEKSLGMNLKAPQVEMHNMQEPEITIDKLPSGRLNEQFIDLMEQLSGIMMKQGEPFRARAYQKAQETIMSYQGDITSPADLKGKPGIGDTIMEKLNEYMKTGTLRILEREKANPVNILGEIYGVGPKKAKELVDQGITTIDQLRAQQDSVLNDTQKVGLKYYEDILKRIPREEIDQYDAIFRNVFNKVAGPGSEARFEIVGSYRRGAKNSGDIDMIITSKTGDVFKKFVDELIKQKIILEVLSRGNTKCLVIAKLPEAEFARRVDFLYTSPEEYPFSVLYFTGSKIFNTVMRGRALALGYSLNEHEMTKMTEKKKGEKATKGEKVAHKFNSEQDIFDFLGMVYKEPHERVDGRSMVLLEDLGKIQVAPLPTTVKEEPVKKEEKVALHVEAEIPVPTSMKAKTFKKPKKLVLQEEAPAKTKTVKIPKKVLLLHEGDDLEKQIAVAEENPQAIHLINIFRKNGISALNPLSETQLSSMVAEANKAFHFNKTPVMTDNEYDIMKEFLEKKFPSSAVLLEVGTPIIEKNKVNLPYEMASMDKIKPDTGALTTWKQKYSGPYVLSCKLDGVSGMYSTEGGIPKLYTRGNGKVGQDVSHLIPYLKLPKTSGKSGIVVRGEFVIPKSVFHDKYATKFANPRNLVAGIVNRQTIDEKVHDLHFVTYEVIVPELKPSAQMRTLMERGFETVLNREAMSGDLTNELLSEILVKWRAEYLYEIDGVIVTNDKVYSRKSGNPDHSFAFKMVLSDQIAEAKVVDVLWTPSKDGYLKPRVQIEPIQLGGVKIEYATGFNAAFIEQNKIGLGALIQIIRSGDVIPHIRSVTTPSEQAKMPNVPYKWNDTHVDIMLEDAGSDETVREKNVTGFFRGIGVDGLSSGNVARIIAAGFETVPAIIHMTKSDFEKAGFKTLAQKFVDGIKSKVDSASLVTLMSASNIFGRGFSEKRIELILEAYPDILVSTDSNTDKVKKIAKIKGMASKTAEAFVEKISDFVKFMNECSLQSKLNGVGAVAVVTDTSHPLYKKSVVMTGIRDATVSEALKTVGANLGSSVSKNTVVVIAKSADEDTGKAAEARKLGIPIMTPSEFMTKYFA
uniref:DNA polymerase lambda n=1 Tax=viral metagenome TaxID=1070528 RepID=A0A6C0DSE8_9ZZZZ